MGFYVHFKTLAVSPARGTPLTLLILTITHYKQTYKLVEQYGYNIDTTGSLNSFILILGLFMLIMLITVPTKVQI